MLATVNEFVKTWGSGKQAHLNLECKNGIAWVYLAFKLPSIISLAKLPILFLLPMFIHKHAEGTRDLPDVTKTVLVLQPTGLGLTN